MHSQENDTKKCNEKKMIQTIHKRWSFFFFLTKKGIIVKITNFATDNGPEILLLPSRLKMNFASILANKTEKTKNEFCINFGE